MILLDTLLKKLELNGVNTRLEVDARYLSKWVKLHPTLFPKYMIEGNFNIIFNEKLLRYEISKNSIQK